MKSLISRWDYVLIVLGIIMVPIGIGLIIIAVVAWKIGTRMERAANKTMELDTGQSESDSINEEIRKQENEETYKCDEYAKEVLEDGR